MKSTIKSDILYNSESRSMIQKKIAYKLLEIFSQHIGRNNHIEKRQLFKKIFGHAYIDDLKDWLRWDFTKKAMTLLRKKSNCFIVSEFIEDEWIYYVVNHEEGVKVYQNRCNMSIKGLEYMKKRCKKSVDQRWYSQNWEISYSNEKIK